MSYSYPVIEDSVARTLLLRFKDLGPSLYEGITLFEGEGPNIVEDVDFDVLHSELRSLWDKSTSRSKPTEFESLGAEIIHKHLSCLPSVVATDNRFWLWFTFVAGNGKLFSIVRDRIGSYEEPNYGLAGLAECLFFRLWWKGYRFSEGDYDLAKRGSAEFWRSHMIRIEYAFGDSMARAFVKFNYPQKGQLFDCDNEFLRTLAKKLTARHASCAFETLTEDECTAILNDIAAEIPKPAKKTKSSSSDK